MKNLLFLIPLFFVSLCLVSCGDDDDKMNPDTDKTTAPMTDDYIATTSVKKVTMTRGYAETRYDLFGIKIYEDYNHLYSLSMGLEQLILYIIKEFTDVGRLLMAMIIMV